MSELPPTCLPQPPREVHGGGGCGLWFMRLFILPHMCIGVYLISQVVLTMLVAAFGTDGTAVVTNTRTTHSAKHGTSYLVDYQFSVNDQLYTDSGTVSAQTYAAVTQSHASQDTPATVRIRFCSIGPLRYQLLTQEDSPWRTSDSLLFGALFWNGLLSGFIYFAWVAPIRNRNLVKFGTATRGDILSFRKERGKGGYSYYATFTYWDPASGRKLTNEMRLPGIEVYEVAKAGRTVTVLYAPNHPKRSLAYELSGYRVSEAHPSVST